MAIPILKMRICISVAKRMVQYFMSKRPRARRFPALGYEHTPHGRQILLFGGQTHLGYTNDLWRLDLIKHEWRFLEASSDQPPIRCKSRLFLSSKGTKLLCGGVGAQGRIYDLWRVTTSVESVKYTPVLAPRDTVIIDVFRTCFTDKIGLVAVNKTNLLNYECDVSIWLLRDDASFTSFEYVSGFTAPNLDIYTNSPLVIPHGTAVIISPDHIVDLLRRRYHQTPPVLVKPGVFGPLTFFDTNTTVLPPNSRLLVTQDADTGNLKCLWEGSWQMWDVTLTHKFSLRSELLMLALLFAKGRTTCAPKLYPNKVVIDNLERHLPLGVPGPDTYPSVHHAKELLECCKTFIKFEGGDLKESRGYSYSNMLFRRILSFL